MSHSATPSLKEEDMIERVAKTMFTAMQERFHTGRLYKVETDVLSEQPWERQPGMYKELDRYRARAAIEAIADHLDCMETGSDEDMLAVEWITGLLRDAALKSPSGVSYGPPEGGTGEYAVSVRFDAIGGKAMLGGGVGKLSSSE